MSTVSIADASRQLSQLVNRAAFGHEVVILTSRGQPKAVLLGAEAFRKLIGAQEKSGLLPLDDFRHQFGEALAEAGYDSREKIVDMVKEVKRELADDRAEHGNPE